VRDDHRLRSWLSRNLFIPWVIHGFRNHGWRQYHAALREARARIHEWEQCDRDSRSALILKTERSLLPAVV
jgi:hypothetical protein